MSVYTFEKPDAPRVDPDQFFNPATQRAFLDLIRQPYVVGVEEDGRQTKLVYGFFFTDRWKQKKGWSLFGTRLELIYCLQAANESLTSGEVKSKYLLMQVRGHLRKAVHAILEPALKLDGYRGGAGLQVIPQSELAAYYYATRAHGPFGPGIVPVGKELNFYLLGFKGEGSERALTVSKFDLPPLLTPKADA